jgi:hypothetical protein
MVFIKPEIAREQSEGIHLFQITQQGRTLEQEILFLEKEGRLHVRQHRKAFGLLSKILSKRSK